MALRLITSKKKNTKEEMTPLYRKYSAAKRSGAYIPIDAADVENLRSNYYSKERTGKDPKQRTNVGPFGEDKKTKKIKKIHTINTSVYDAYEHGDRPVYYYGLLKYSLDCICVDHEDATVTKANIVKAVTTFLNADPKRREMTRPDLELEIMQHFELNIPVLQEYLDELFAQKSPAPAVLDAVPATPKEVAVPSGVAVAADEANQPNNAEKLISMMAEQNIKSNAVQHQQNQQSHEQNQQTTRNINQLTSNIASIAASIVALREHSVAQDARLNDQDTRIDGIAMETTVNGNQTHRLFKSQTNLGQVIAESSQQVAESAQKIASLKEQVDALSTAKKLNCESPSPDRKRKALPGLQQHSASRRSTPSVTFSPSTRFPPSSTAEASSLPGSGIAAMPGSGASSSPLESDMLATPSPALVSFLAGLFSGPWSSAKRAAALLADVSEEERESSSNDEEEKLASES